MGKNGKTKQAAKANDPYRITWEKMKAHEVEYAKSDLKEMDVLADLLHKKFLDSLTQEQYLMYITGNHANMMIDEFNPAPPNLRDVRDECERTGRYYTLDIVRDHLRKVQSLLLGRRMGTFYEENQRNTEMHKVLDALTQPAPAEKAKGA